MGLGPLQLCRRRTELAVSVGAFVMVVAGLGLPLGFSQYARSRGWEPWRVSQPRIEQRVEELERRLVRLESVQSAPGSTVR